jgi:ABC-2 type transport system ATP-binding protein
MPGEPLIQAEGLARRHVGREVLRGAAFTLDAGQALGLLGVNGAGKSTLLRILAGVLAPDAGRVRIAGADLREDPAAARTRVGWLPERAPLYPELTVAESLAFAARLRGLGGAAARAAVDRAIERCGLGEVRKRLCANLSRGFAQRAGLAQAIVHEPPVLLLDEPTAGLDPLQAQRFHELLASLKPGRAIVLSSHQLAEVQAGCDLAAVLHAGVLDPPAPPGDGRALSQRFMALALGAAAA